jgi:sigma-B regulation protein RsbU (phosphoserine phosphatase)
MKKLYLKFSKRFTYDSIEKNLLVKILSLITLSILALVLIFSGDLIWQHQVTKSLQEESSEELSTTLTQELQNSNEITLMNLTEALSKQIDFRFESLESGLKYISDFIAAHYDDPDYKKVITEYLQLLDTNNNTESHFIQFANGIEISPNLVADSASTVDHRNRDWYKKTAETKAFTISNYFISNDVGHARVIAFAYPITVNGQFIGVTGVVVKIADLGNMILDTDSQVVQDALMISNDGHFIKSTRDDEDTHTFVEENWDKVKALQEESRTNGTDDGETSYAEGVVGSKPISIISPSKANWSVMMVFDFSEINDGLYRIPQLVSDSRGNVLASNTILGFVAIIVVLGAAVAIFVLAYKSSRRSAKRITDPIVEIVKKIDAVTQGDFHQDFSTIKTGDEIEHIAKATEEMMVSLENHIEQIKNATAEKEHAQAQLDVATTIQIGMLPNVFPAFPDRKDLSLYASMTPAQEVGGDFYDFFFIDDYHFATVIADVSGKGVSAALFMAISKTVIQNVAMSELDPGKILFEVNNNLQRNNDAMMFATCFLAIIDIRTGEVKYSNAGHNPPLIFRNDRAIEYTGEVKSLPLAIVEDTQYPVGEFCLQKFDRLVLYTDGVTEAFDSQGNEFGTANLEGFFLERPTEKLSLTNLTHSLQRKVLKFSDGKQFDDITLLMFSLCNENSFSSLVVQAEKETIYDIYSFVDRNLERNNSDSKIYEKFHLIIEELFVNIASYAYKPDEIDRVVEINFDIVSRDGSEFFQLTFRDHGVKYDPTEIADPDLSLSVEEREIGGLGVFMSKQLSDIMEYTREGEENVLRIGIKKEDNNA